MVLEHKKDTGEVLISIPDDGKEMMTYSSFSRKKRKSIYKFFIMVYHTYSSVFYFTSYLLFYDTTKTKAYRLWYGSVRKDGIIFNRLPSMTVTRAKGKLRSCKFRTVT